MQFALYAAMVLSIVVVGIVRVDLTTVDPRAGAWATLVAGWVLTGCMIGGLVLVASPLPARVPFVAALGDWKPDSIRFESPIPVAASSLAMLLLAWLGWRAVRELRILFADRRELDGTHRAIRRGNRGAVVVLDEDVPNAYALAGTIRHRGRIVMTAGLLDLLDDEERAAALAHERAHLRHHHALFEIAGRMMVACNPLLGMLNRDLGFLLERWADEESTLETSTPVVASALSKAALGMVSATRQRVARCALGWAGRGDVTTRIRALLDEDGRRRRRAIWALGIVAVLTAAALAWAMHDTERFFETARLWTR
jgi:beta-lactamase regulating signal transducer with metallopeptidase domain